MKPINFNAVLLIVCLLMTGCFGSKDPVGNLDNPEQAVETGKAALQKGFGYNWYDEIKDDVAAVQVEPPPKQSTSSGFWDWLDDLFSWPSFGEFFKFLSYVCVAIAICAIVYLLVKSKLTQNNDHTTNIKKKKSRLIPTLEQVEALPLAGRNPNADFLAEAKRHYVAGNFTDAIVYLFSYRLLQLDRHHFVRLAKGKTNRQYLREIESHSLSLRRRIPREEIPVQSYGVEKNETDRSGVAQLLKATTHLFEEAFFGKHPPGRKQFEKCWEQNQRFQTLLAESASIVGKGEQR